MTIRQIADLAGVSPAAVSMVLNNRPGIGDEKRRAILELLEVNGYQPRSGKKENCSILFVKYTLSGSFVELNGDFITRVLNGVQEEAEHAGFNLVMRNISSNTLDDVFGLFDSGRFAGAIVLGTEMDDRISARFLRASIPVVFLDNPTEQSNLDAVIMDNRGGTFMAVQHLIEQGHTEIGFIMSNFAIPSFKQRYEGYRLTLEENCLPYNPKYVYQVTPTMEGAYRDMLDLLAERRPMPTAFFAGNDSICIGALKAVKQCGYAVPDQVSMIGFDDLPFCAVSEPLLTTLSIPNEKMGRLAVKRLHDKLHDDSPLCLKLLVRPTLVVRDSVADLRKQPPQRPVKAGQP